MLETLLQEPVRSSGRGRPRKETQRKMGSVPILTDGKVVALVDEDGNLALRGPAEGEDPGNLNATGIVIANGVPFTLENKYFGDSHSNYQ